MYICVCTILSPNLYSLQVTGKKVRRLSAKAPFPRQTDLTSVASSSPVYSLKEMHPRPPAHGDLRSPTSVPMTFMISFPSHLTGSDLTFRIFESSNWL